MESSDPNNFNWRPILVFVLIALSTGVLEYIGQMIAAGIFG